MVGGRTSSRVNEGMGHNTHLKMILDLTTGLEFEPHTTLLKEARKDRCGGQREVDEECRDER
jgi:hypothetical protein